MIKYVIQVKKNPLKKNEVKYYPQAALTTPSNIGANRKADRKTLYCVKC